MAVAVASREAAGGTGLGRVFGTLSAERTVALTLSALVTLLVVVPLVAVLAAGLDDRGSFSLRHILSVLGATKIILNTVMVGVFSTALAVAIGGTLAIVLIRINTPGRQVLERLMSLPLYITPLLTAIAWSWLGSPRGGLINKFAREVLGLSDGLVNLHSPAGVIVVAALSYVPLVFLLVGGALRGMDPSLEDSARVHGASPFHAFRLVTAPLVLPAVLGSALLVFVQAIGLFSVPAVLGMPSSFYVATTEIYRLLDNYPPRVGQAAAWGLVLLAVTVGLVALQSAILNRRSFVTITGKAFRPRLVQLGGVRYLLAALAWLYIALAVALPVLTLVWAASISFLTVDLSLMEFSAKHFRYILFDYPKTYLALQNSLLLGAATATIVCALGLAISWVVIRTRSRARTYLDQVSMFPLSTPAMVFALGLLWVYVGLKVFPIYGTIWILLVAYVTHYLPFGVRAANGALRQLHPELEDAARVSGASWMKTIRLVTFPLTRPTLTATWMLMFILAMQEVSSSILLYSSRSIVLSVVVFDLWEAGNASGLAALSVLQLAVTFVAMLVLIRARHREVIS